MRTRTLVVDDSALVRNVIVSALRAHPAIEVVGEASDGAAALRRIADLKPDVVTLDVEMPGMNGIQLLEKAGRLPCAYLMCSTLTQRGADITLEALRLGAFDYVTKPDATCREDREAFREEIQQKVLAAHRSKDRLRKPVGALSTSQRGRAPSLPPNRTRGWVVAIGISCGGPQTLHELLPQFPSDFVPIVVTQHMPHPFTTSFARQLGSHCAMKVLEAQDRQPLRPGEILIAPGNRHLCFRRAGVEIVTDLQDGPRVSGHKPAVDAMFSSLASICGNRTLGIVMTGMGSDGARGVVELSAAGGFVMAQDESSSIVFGMPKAAIGTGCVREVVPLDRVAEAIAKRLAAKPAMQPSAG